MTGEAKTNPIQTQTNPIKANLQNDQNEHNFSINKALWKYTTFRAQAKRTQFKPKRTQFGASACKLVVAVSQLDFTGQP